MAENKRKRRKADDRKYEKKEKDGWQKIREKRERQMAENKRKKRKADGRK